MEKNLAEKLFPRHLEALKISPLFRAVSEEELRAMLGCLGPSYVEYERNSYILRQGESISGLGLVLSGTVHIIEEDFWGARSIIAEAAPGQLFAEVYACIPGEPLKVSAVAQEKSAVLFLDIARVLNTCSSACRFHTQLVANLLAAMAGRSLQLTEKLSHMAKRTTRDKLLSYLSDQSRRQGSASFTISFNRQQLADYLCVDRSAMSNELSKLRDDGVLDFERNSFTLRLPEQENY